MMVQAWRPASFFFMINLSDFQFISDEKIRHEQNMFSQSLLILQDLLVYRHARGVQFFLFLTHLDKLVELVELNGLDPLIKLVPEAKG